MKIFSFIAAFAFAFTLINCSSTSKNSGRGLAQAGGNFSGAEQWAEMQQIAATLDMTAASGTSLKPSSGGTSVYAVLTRNNSSYGAVIPQNGASQISGEILSYTLARAFGFPHLYQRGIYFFLTGDNYEAFKTIVPTSPVGDPNKEKNRQNLIKRIQDNPGGIDTVFKRWDQKPMKYEALNTNNTLNASHVLSGSSKPFASFLQCNGPMPSNTTKVTINGGTTSELEAARQFSSILLVDAIMKQWDRFSGGNIETVNINGTAHFVSFDNGGTWQVGWITKNLKLVSRFDRDVAEKILALNRFMNENSGDYQGLKTQADLAAALGMEKFPTAMATIKDSIKEVATHIQNNPNCFF